MKQHPSQTLKTAWKFLIWFFKVRVVREFSYIARSFESSRRSEFGPRTSILMQKLIRFDISAASLKFKIKSRNEQIPIENEAVICGFFVCFILFCFACVSFFCCSRFREKKYNFIHKERNRYVNLPVGERPNIPEMDGWLQTGMNKWKVKKERTYESMNERATEWINELTIVLKERETLMPFLQNARGKRPITFCLVLSCPGWVINIVRRKYDQFMKHRLAIPSLSDIQNGVNRRIVFACVDERSENTYGPAVLAARPVLIYAQGRKGDTRTTRGWGRSLKGNDFGLTHTQHYIVWSRFSILTLDGTKAFDWGAWKKRPTRLSSRLK